MSSVYEEYMRNVLGYEPIRYRDTYDAEYNDYMNYSNFNIPQQFETNIETSRLESCYPDIYNLVYPMVKKACSKNNRALSSDLVDELTNEIYNAIEDDSLNENRTSEIKNRSIDVKTSSKSIENKTNLIRQESSSKEDRQIRNQGLQDLIKILLIRELINNSGFRPRFYAKEDGNEEIDNGNCDYDYGHDYGAFCKCRRNGICWMQNSDNSCNICKQWY